MAEKVTTQFRAALSVLDDGNRIYGKVRFLNFLLFEFIEFLVYLFMVLSILSRYSRQKLIQTMPIHLSLYRKVLHNLSL